MAAFGRAWGTVRDAARGRYAGKPQGENSLRRTRAEAREPGAVRLAERSCRGWFDLAGWWQRGVDGVTRWHQRRPGDLRRGRRLGKSDHRVVGTKPVRPDGMAEATCPRLPDQLAVREVRVRVRPRGFRTKVRVLVTTLLDAQVDPARDLAVIDRRRGQAELERRSWKVTLHLDVLRWKSPARAAPSRTTRR